MSANKQAATNFPDDYTNVLLRLDHKDYPLITGFPYEDKWRDSGGMLLTTRVLWWMHLEDAAKILDQHAGDERKEGAK